MAIYYFLPSNNTRKVHAVAIHLNLPQELQWVNLRQREQRASKFLKLNSTGKTPVVQDGDFIL
jgi:glutathione S-transferase